MPLSAKNTENMDKNLGYNIRKMRELRGYDQKYMADGLGIDPTSYGHVESGKTKLSVDRLKKIADLLDTTPEAIEKIDDANIFHIINNNCTNGAGSGYVTIHNSFDELLKFYDKLIEPYKLQLVEKDKELASKNEEIQSLRSQLKKQA